MKKLLVLCLALCLTGCGRAAAPQAAARHTRSKNRVTRGHVIGVDTPEGLTARESSDALSADGMYYATWSAGDAVPYVNEYGEDAQLYDAQLYVLLSGYASTEKAEEGMEELLSMAAERYTIEETKTEAYNGQEFTIITYAYKSETNPYAQGVSAFGAYGNYNIIAELSCRENFEGDALELLEDFLEHCHYVA